MASITPQTPQFSNCAAFCANDYVLGPILVFYRQDPATPAGARIEAHVFSHAGFQSYPKLVLPPSSPLYAACNHLPPSAQNDETCRALSIVILKYFTELPKPVKEAILRHNATGQAQAVAFDEMHAGDLAARFKELESDSLPGDLGSGLAEKFVNAIDIDIVARTQESRRVTADDLPEQTEKFLECFGEPANVPFMKLKRSASRPARPRIKSNYEELVQRELDELRQTEGNYVAKVQELLEDIAKPLKARAVSRQGGLWEVAQEIEALFPSCLERIIEFNQKFLEDIRDGDIVQVAKACQTHFPSFRTPYEEYLRASAEFPQLISRLQSKDRNGSFTRKLQQTGEQKMRSLVIEPVQRLPRYSLLIDNIINLLPKDHPATDILDSAREIVADTCNLQSSGGDSKPNATRRLQQMVITWPVNLRPKGRLVAAIDVTEVFPPFNNNTSDTVSLVVLLLAECVVFLRRPKSSSLQARALMAELENPGSSGLQGSGSKRDSAGYDLVFGGWIDLASVKTASSDGGATLWMLLKTPLKDAYDTRPAVSTMRKFHLINQYEGRAGKVEEEFAKARLERRIGGSTKGIVGLREIRHSGVTVWSCVWADPRRYAEAKNKGTTLVYVDAGGDGPPAKELIDEVANEVEISMAVELRSSSRGAMLKLETRSMNEYSSQDSMEAASFMPVFIKRMSALLRQHHNIQHPPLTDTLLAANQKLISSLGIPFDGSESSRFGKLRAPSPVKVLSSILNPPGGTLRGRGAMHGRSQSQIISPTQFDRGSMLLRGTTAIGVVGAEEPLSDEARHKITMADSPIRKLEQAFECLMAYISTVGKQDADFLPLHDTSNVDMKHVNDLLNKLIEDPRIGTIPDGTPIDVVVIAFYEFMHKEWVEGMGPLISPRSLQELQLKSDTLYPNDFDDFFRIFLLDWTPQNKRAFKSLVSLLKKLQSRVERGDTRGALTKCFTEILVGEHGNPLDYMGLVDRLVEDMDKLFNESAPIEELSTLNGHTRMMRAKSVTTDRPAPAGSIRKRFGLTHSSSMRENGLGKSPEPSDSKAQSLWRTLSKRDADAAKGHLAKSRSIDYGQNNPRRPPSRDRPAPSMSSAVIEPSTPRVQPRSTTPAPGMSPSPVQPLNAPKTPRRKRRSSLSDLTSHPEFMMFDPGPPLDPPPKTPGQLERASSARSTPPVRSYSPVVPEPLKPAASPKLERSGAISRATPPKLVPTRRELPKPNQSTSGIPTGSLTAAARLRFESGPKIRERHSADTQLLSRGAQDDYSKLSNGDQELMAEMAKIGRELSMASTKTTNAAHQAQYNELASRVENLERRVRVYDDEFARKDAQRIQEENARLKAEIALRDAEFLRREAEAARQHAEAALVRKKDDLKNVERQLKAANAENDIIFDQFNKELEKMAAGFKANKAEAELVRLLNNLQAKQSELKKENQSLRREINVLRSGSASSRHSTQY